MRIRSLSFKLALLVGMLGLLQAIAVLVFSYNTMSGSLDEQKRRLLHDKVNEVRQLLDQEPDLTAVRGAAYRLSELLTGHEDLYVAVATPNKGPRLIAFSPIAVESLQRLEHDIWANDAFLEWRSRESNKPMLSIASASEVQNNEEYIIVLSADQSGDKELLSKFLITALTAAPFALALVCLGALIIVSIGLRPLNRFRQAAIAVSTQSLADRIDPAKLPVELIPLCHAFNGMLDRLDEGIRRLSQFSADLAHEMRTPIATLLGRTQVTLSQPRSHAQLLALIEGNVEELERLSRLVSDMLFLAHAENAEASAKLAKVDLAVEVTKVTSYLEFIAQERGIRFRIIGHGNVAADQSLVQRAVTNLLSNAIRYGAPDSEVSINIAEDSREVALDVMNHGQPIPVEHRARLFDRFYRADASRAREAGGTGLGLAIVKAIMTLHGGSVDVDSDAHGVTHFLLRFPVKPLPQAPN